MTISKESVEAIQKEIGRLSDLRNQVSILLGVKLSETDALQAQVDDYDMKIQHLKTDTGDSK